MREPLLAHKIISLEGSLQVTQVNPNGDPHEQVLRSLSYLAVRAEQVGFLKRLKAKEVVIEVSRVVNHFIYALIVVLNDIVHLFREKWRSSAHFIPKVVEIVCHGHKAAMGPIVQRLDRHVIGKLRVVGVHDGHVSASFSC